MFVQIGFWLQAPNNQGWGSDSEDDLTYYSTLEQQSCYSVRSQEIRTSYLPMNRQTLVSIIWIWHATKVWRQAIQFPTHLYKTASALFFCTFPALPKYRLLGGSICTLCKPNGLSRETTLPVSLAGEWCHGATVMWSVQPNICKQLLYWENVLVVFIVFFFPSFFLLPILFHFHH